ncbi:hypothetical protein BGW41_008320, partial [Actinomortierella wolfii]
WSSLGAREDGIFLMASRDDNTAGNAYFFPPNTTQPPSLVQFTNLPGNAVQFCGANFTTCYADLAIDGNGYLWVITGQGELYISTTPQTTAFGGQMKHIGTLSIPNFRNSAAIAFDMDGNVYFGGRFTDETGYIYKAPMEDPLNGSIVLTDVPYVIDLATCAYPKNDISHLLA